MSAPRPKAAFDGASKPGDIANFTLKTLFGPQGYQDGLETIALSLLPLIAANRDKLADKARNVPILVDMILSDVDYADVSRRITSIPKSAVTAVVEKMSNSDSDLIKRARGIRNRALTMERQDYIDFCLAIDSVLPPALARGPARAQTAGDTYDLLATLSEDDIAAALAVRKQRQPVAEISDGLYDLLQQCTSQRMKTLVTHLNDNIGGAAIGLLMKRFWESADEILTAAEAGNFSKPANPAKVRAFGRSLRDTLTTIEEGFGEAGFSLPQQISDYLRDDIGAGKLLREAVALREARNGTSQGIAVTKPLQLKRPGT